jgi:hypothetical protein
VTTVDPDRATADPVSRPLERRKLVFGIVSIGLFMAWG